MSNAFSAGKKALATCDRCGRTCLLKTLKALVVRTKQTGLLVCGECWEADHPQLMQGMYPVSDPQALRTPRPDQSKGDSGSNSSRDIQWGWAPVGGAFYSVGSVTPNNLVATASVGTVTIAVT